MVDAGRVDDARPVAEAIGVVAGGRHVQRLVVERRREQALVEVAADHGDVAQRCAGTYPQAAERRDDAAAHGVGEREVGDLGGEDVADVLLQQLVGRRHPDVRRLREAPDARARALAERRVGLVAQHDGVRVRVEVLVVLDEPRVRLDRHRRRLGDAPAAVDRGPQARAVPLLAQVALELVDEQPAMRQDQHAGRAAGIDEAGGGHGLARRGRMLEAVAPARAGIGRGRLGGLRGVGGEVVGIDRSIRVGDRLVVLVLVLVLVLDLFGVDLAVVGVRLVVGSSSSSSSSPRSKSPIRAASMPARASTWWARSVSPDASAGVGSERMRSSPSMSAKRLRNSGLGRSRPLSISRRAASSAPRRAVPGASARSGSSPACSSDSPHHAATTAAADSRLSCAGSVSAGTEASRTGRALLASDPRSV